MADTPTAPQTVSRAVHLMLAGVIAMAFVGFFVGIRQGTTTHDHSLPDPTPSEPHPEAIAATSYRDFDRRQYGPNRHWHNTLANLRQPANDSAESDHSAPDRSEQRRRETLTARAQRRAFDGAPPVVPHPIDQQSTASCMACHGEGLAIGTLARAPKMSHPFLANCTQCHVEQHASDLAALLVADNLFEGSPAPVGGQRAWSGAPPTVPHPVFMRENCLSCHGPHGSEPMRTTHRWRVNCLQCHAPSAVLDQVAENFQTLDDVGSRRGQGRQATAAPGQLEAP